MRKWQKTLVLGLILVSLAKFGPQKYFSWILPLLDVRHCCQLSLSEILKKTNKTNLRKWQKNWFPDDFGPFGTNLATKAFLRWFYFYQTLDIVTSYHCMQFQGKLMNETWENGKKCSFNRDLVPFGPNSGCHFFFFKNQMSWSAIIMYNIRKN